MNTIWEKADAYWHLDKLSAGPWQGDGPKGITLHYTADDNLNRTLLALDKGKMGYHFIVDRDGQVHQITSLGSRVNHAGVAKWNGQSPNRTHIAVAVLSWGLLENGMSWAKRPVFDSVKRRGHEWHSATQKQEEATLSLIEALRESFGILPQNICGHDECCIPLGRKVDPGGVLSVSTDQIRRGMMS